MVSLRYRRWRVDPKEDDAYRKERERAQATVVERSMNRRLGRLSKLPAGDLPAKADNSNYDPRKW